MPNRVIGLTGGIASGKTTMTSKLRALGYEVVDADAIARAVLDPDSKGWRLVVEAFGEDLVLSNGFLDRKKLREIVFKDPSKRQVLEGITHPLIKEEIFVAIDKALKRSETLIFVDVPLLFEAKYDQYFTFNIVIDVDVEVQKRRLMLRDGIDENLAKQMIDAQMPIAEKKRRASHIIKNEGGISEFEKAIEALTEVFKNL